MDAGSEPSERLLHNLIDGGPQITIVVDGLGQITYSSANISTLFGYEPAEGQDFIELRAKTVSGDVVLEQL